MPQQIKVLAAKGDDLNPVPGSYMVEVVLWPPHTLCGTQAPPPTKAHYKEMYFLMK